MRILRRISPIVWGIIGFFLSLLIYSLTVILTTPNLQPLKSLEISFALNPQVAIGVPLGVGIQAYLSSYFKRMPCPTGTANSAVGGTISGSVLSAFFSFFSLTQVGCCTLWLFYLSLLPSVVGVGAAGFLISYSSLLSNLSLALVWMPVGFLLWRIRTQTRRSR